MSRDLPVRMLRSGSAANIEEFLASLRREHEEPGTVQDDRDTVTAEAEAAAREVLAHGEPVELPAQPAALRRRQHAVAERLGIQSVSRGREPYRRVVLLPAASS